MCVNVSMQCSGVSTAATTSFPVASTSPADVCNGRSLTSGEACVCASDCHTCAFVGGSPGMCTVCKNAAVLLDGACVPASACVGVGGVVEGFGNFKRRCLAPQSSMSTAVVTSTHTPAPTVTCAARERSDNGLPCTCPEMCHVCHLDPGDGSSSTCTMCKSAQLLLAGACVPLADCLAQGGAMVGYGRFNLRCAVSATVGDATPVTFPPGTQCHGRATTASPPQPCVCLSDCHSCEYTGSGAGACFYCKNSQYLLDGQCVPASDCPAGLRGSGKFGRTCLLLR